MARLAVPASARWVVLALCSSSAGSESYGQLQEEPRLVHLLLCGEASSARLYSGSCGKPHLATGGAAGEQLDELQLLSGGNGWPREKPQLPWLLPLWQGRAAHSPWSAAHGSSSCCPCGEAGSAGLCSVGYGRLWKQPGTAQFAMGGATGKATASPAAVHNPQSTVHGSSGCSPVALPTVRWAVLGCSCSHP